LSNATVEFGFSEALALGLALTLGLIIDADGLGATLLGAAGSGVLEEQADKPAIPNAATASIAKEPEERTRVLPKMGAITVLQEVRRPEP